jgi:hypothetical protein
MSRPSLRRPVVSVFSANRDPLLDAADLHEPAFVDGVRRSDGVVARVPSRGWIHFVVGGGLALKRAHSVIDEPPFRGVDEVARIRLLHGRIGADWDVFRRLVIRPAAVGWMGDGLVWVVGGRVGLGYRF